MKSRYLIFAAFLLVSASNAFGWTCPSGQHHVQTTKGTPGAVLVEGEYFVCVPDTPVTSPNPSQNQSQSQNQNQSQTANGGNSNSTSKSNSSSTANGGNSTVKNSGNSSNSNSNTAVGGTASSTASAANNGNNSNNASYSNQTEVKAAAATAFSTAAPTAPCVVGYGFGGQLVGGGLSLSGGKIDKNCAILETARSASLHGSDIAYCKVYITDKWAKQAGVTFDDCMKTRQVIVPVQPAPQPVPVSINVVPVPIQGTTVPETGTVPVAEQHVLLHDFGFCPFFNGNPTNACYRILDDAVAVLRGNPSTKIFLTGPIETVKLLPYLKTRVATTRIGLQNFTDDNDKLSIQVFGTEGE